MNHIFQDLPSPPLVKREGEGKIELRNVCVVSLGFQFCFYHSKSIPKSGKNPLG